MAIGATGGVGLSFTRGEGFSEAIGGHPEQRELKSAWEAGGYFQSFFYKGIGFETGFGVIRKGVYWDTDNAYRRQIRILYLEIPLLFKVDRNHFRLAAGMAYWGAITASHVIWDQDRETERWTDHDWRYVHRHNIGPKVMLGLALTFDNVTIVPSMAFRMHLRNDIDVQHVIEDASEWDRPDSDLLQSRFYSVMIQISLEKSLRR
ncbi:MAG: hypothetical protein JXX29_11525 [Deltaproteobacteria bacterium]|nr:hypothetical protein [Deltaproteobacteria bacterium]